MFRTGHLWNGPSLTCSSICAAFFKIIRIILEFVKFASFRTYLAIIKSYFQTTICFVVIRSRTRLNTRSCFNFGSRSVVFSILGCISNANGNRRYQQKCWPSPSARFLRFTIQVCMWFFNMIFFNFCGATLMIRGTFCHQDSPTFHSFGLGVRRLANAPVAFTNKH